MGMRLMIRNNGRASSMFAGLACGGVVSLVVTLFLTAVLAWMITSERMQQFQIGYGIMAILTVSAFLGVKAASGKIKRRYLMVSAASGCVYFVTLLALTALFFGGQYSGVGETALMVFCGSTLAFLLRRRHKKPSTIGKIKMHYR